MRQSHRHGSLMILLVVLIAGCKMEMIGDEISKKMAENSFPEFSPEFPPATKFLYWREVSSRDQYRVLLKGEAPYHLMSAITRSFGIADDELSSEVNPHMSFLGLEIPPHWEPQSLTQFQSAGVRAVTHDGKPVFLTITYEDKPVSDVIRFYIEYIVFID